MPYLYLLATAAVLFLAMPWLAIAFDRYCRAVNRLMAQRARRKQRKA